MIKSSLGLLLEKTECITFRAVRRISAACRACYEEAYDALRRAKALHDELEAVYRPYVDFPALTDYTEQSVRELFGEET